MKYTFSQHLAHFFHVVSNIRPIIWIGLYICSAPIFALIYWGLPDGQFRVPDGEVTDYGSWLYYSIVTITTLGFGDYTPAQGAAQAVTAIEVMCGLIFLGLFLNAVGAMKSEIDVESEIEKQKALHHAAEEEKLRQSVPMLITTLNVFITNCEMAMKMNSIDHSSERKLLHSASKASLVLDSLQQRVDLTLWPDLLEDCFSFVADYQMFSAAEHSLAPNVRSSEILLDYIKGNDEICKRIVTKLGSLATTS